MALKKLLFLIPFFPWAFAANICPPLGPVFPPPTGLHMDDSFRSNLSKTLNDILKSAYSGGNTSYGPLDSNAPSAIQIFSIDDESSPLYEHYHDGIISNSTYGTKRVDGDSIFPIGSISKLLGVYTLLLEIGDESWDRKLTSILPELRSQPSQNGEDAVNYIDWGDITLGTLAGQMSGITRSASVIDKNLLVDNATSYGVPPLSPTQFPLCIENETFCDRDRFFQALTHKRPVFLPHTTPSYSNTNFALLGYALESIVGKDLSSLMQRSLIDPLKLTSTSYTRPKDSSRGVIPGDFTSSGWNYDISDILMAGGVFSTSNDLSTIGRSILQSSLLDANTTRAWMKPISHTSSLTASVGRPWEITRYTKTRQNRVVDIYTKSGDIGVYHNSFALIPEYNVGFSLLVAGSSDRIPLSGVILDALIPALEEVTQRQADTSFTGSYSAKNGLNSSIAFSTKDSDPGLFLTKWISNNTDMLNFLQTSLRDLTGGVAFGPETRLYPTNLNTNYGNGTEKVSWRIAVDSFLPTGADIGMFPGCLTWFDLDAITYGTLALDNFVFTMQNGKAVSVEPEVVQLAMDRDN